MMNCRKMIRRICGRNGSYILEASITLPVFLIAVTVMCSVILMYSCIEDCNFIAANEIRRGAAEAALTDTSLLIPYRTKKAAVEGHSRVETARIRDYGYRISRWGQDELIVMTMELGMNSPNPIGINARANYDISVVTRAYVGKTGSSEPMTASEMSGNEADAVFIFPARGEKYHNRGCGFLKAASTSSALTPEIRRHYRPCPVCGSRNASPGTLIYYFPSAGDDYHLPGCSVLQRNYIEIDRQDAVRRGYTPCAKCGG